MQKMTHVIAMQYQKLGINVHGLDYVPTVSTVKGVVTYAFGDKVFKPGTPFEKINAELRKSERPIEKPVEKPPVRRKKADG
jgi:hypothetical protein